MKLISACFCFITILLIQNCNAGILSPTARITIHVIDAKGNAIPDAEVGVDFYQAKAAGWGKDTHSINGRTDKNGLFTAESKSADYDYCDFDVKKNGFYKSSDRAHFQQVDIVLKEKRNPVSMYAKRMSLLPVPVLNVPIGYDLEKGDLVAPYGKGVVQDFIYF